MIVNLTDKIQTNSEEYNISINVCEKKQVNFNS